MKDKKTIGQFLAAAESENLKACDEFKIAKGQIQKAEAKKLQSQDLIDRLDAAYQKMIDAGEKVQIISSIIDAGLTIDDIRLVIQPVEKIIEVEKIVVKKVGKTGPKSGPMKGGN